MRRGRAALLATAVAAGISLLPALAQAADPRDDVANAYITAFEQLENFELEGAQATLEAAIATGISAGLAGDPSLAKMHAMRAGIIYSLSQDAAQAQAACLEAVKLDHNIQPPIELRSEELLGLCDQARASVAAPSEAVVHTPPVGTPNADIEFVALANTTLPEGSSLVLYWRTAGTDAEFEGRDMFGDGGNWGATTITAAEHQGKDIQYFFYAFDPTRQPLVNRGDKQSPLLLEMDENAVVAAGDADPGEGSDEGGEDADKGEDAKPARGKSSLPRVFINLGIGTGVGIARGTAELTYEQYTPGIPGAVYGPAEQACAIERWYGDPNGLAQDPFTFQQHLAAIEPYGAVPYTPGDEDARARLSSVYDPGYCGKRHPVSTGLAVAPFHIAPEIGVRVGRAVVVSVFGRLQVVTGSKVFTDDTTLPQDVSYSTQVRSTTPPGVQQKPGFTWAIGAKVKYFFGKDDRKFRLFGGGFAGYGQARLRVPMNFSNDRNGNSVPDLGEVGLTGPLNDMQQVDPDTCVPVWPYNNGCVGGEVGQADRDLAVGLRNATPRDDERVDTVVIGPAMFGAVFGFHYQLHKNFALFAELNVGAWLPATSSALFDLNLGPSITF